MAIKKSISWILLLLLTTFCIPPSARAESCKNVVQEFNKHLPSSLDEQELIEILQTLNGTENKRLPSKFVTKRKAKERGWKPGKDLWSLTALKGASIGGDRFGNREGRLPEKKWREADLDYKGGHRGSKRVIFSDDGKRFVTVNHYKNFIELPSCQ